MTRKELGTVAGRRYSYETTWDRDRQRRLIREYEQAKMRARAAAQRRGEELQRIAGAERKRKAAVEERQLARRVELGKEAPQRGTEIFKPTYGSSTFDKAVESAGTREIITVKEPEKIEAAVEKEVTRLEEKYPGQQEYIKPEAVKEQLIVKEKPPPERYPAFEGRRPSRIVQDGGLRGLTIGLVHELHDVERTPYGGAMAGELTPEAAQQVGFERLFGRVGRQMGAPTPSFVESQMLEPTEVTLGAQVGAAPPELFQVTPTGVITGAMVGPVSPDVVKKQVLVEPTRGEFITPETRGAIMMGDVSVVRRIEPPQKYISPIGFGQVLEGLAPVMEGEVVDGKFVERAAPLIIQPRRPTQIQTLGEAGDLETGLYPYVKDIPFARRLGKLSTFPLIGGLSQQRFIERQKIEAKYEAAIRKAKTVGEIKRLEANRDIEVEASLYAVKPLEGKIIVKEEAGRYEPTVSGAVQRISKLDIPGYDVSLGMGAAGAVTLAPIALYAMGVPVPAPTPTIAVARGVSGVVTYGTAVVAGEEIREVTDSPFLGLATTLGVLYAAPKLGKALTERAPLRVEAIDLPGTGKAVIVGIKKQPLAGIRGVPGKGFQLLGKKGVESFVKPLAIKPGEAGVMVEGGVPGFMPSGPLETQLAFAAAAKTPTLPPTEFQRAELGVEIGRLLERQQSLVTRPEALTDLFDVKKLPPPAVTPTQEAFRRLESRIIVKGSLATAPQLTPERAGLREIVDIDIAAIKPLTPEGAQKVFIEEYEKAGVKYKIIKGQLALKQPTGKYEKVFDIKTKELLEIQEEMGDIVPERRLQKIERERFGLRVDQPPIKIAGQKVVPLSELMVRALSTSITFQQEMVGPLKPGRVYKDILRFQEQTAPQLIESAKARPTTYLRGMKAEQLLEEFKATRGVDFTRPLPRKPDVTFRKILGVPFRAEKPTLRERTVRDIFKVEPSLPPKITPRKDRVEFFVASEEALSRAFPSRRRPPRFPAPSLSVISKDFSRGLPSAPSIPKRRPSPIPSMAPSVPSLMPSMPSAPPSMPSPIPSPPPSMMPYVPSIPSMPSRMPSKPSPPPSMPSPRPSMPSLPSIPPSPPPSPAPDMLVDLQPPTKIPRIPPIMFPKDDKRKPGYDVFVKRRQEKKGKGKYLTRGFKKANRAPMTWGYAFRMGTELVDEYTNRTFFLRRSGRPAQKLTPHDIARTPRAGLLPITQLKGKVRRVKKKDARLRGSVYTEKTKYAIDSRGEKMGIPYESLRLRKAGLLNIKPRRRGKTKRKVRK